MFNSKQATEIDAGEICPGADNYIFKAVENFQMGWTENCVKM